MDNTASPLIQALQAQEGQPDLGASLLSGYQQGIMRPLQMQQVQQQYAQQQQAFTAQQDALNDPSPANIVKWGIADPTHFEAIKASHDAMTSDAQRQDVQDATSVYGYLQANNADGAAKILQQRVDAGQDNLAPLLNMVNSGDPAQIKQAQAAAGMILAGKVGPDKFAEAYNATQSNARDNAKLPGELASTTANTAKTVAETNQITNPRPETAATPGADGNPIFYNKNAAPPANASASTNSPALSALIPKLIGSESGGDPNAKNPNSSATGAGQFLNKTWVPLFKQLHPDLAEGKTDAQILAYRSNPQYAAEGVAAYARQNADTLGSAGLPVNGATLAMAHKLGPGGAQAVLAADPNAPLSSVLPAEVIKANPQLAKMTAGQYGQSLVKQFGTDPINAAPDPSSTGDDFLATLPPGRAKLIKAIANGDAPMPTGRSATTGAGQALMQQVLQYDPTASSLNLQTRQVTRQKFTTGPEGQAITAANTLIGHLVSLRIAAEQLNSGSIPMFNAASNAIRFNAGDAQRQSAIGKYNALRTPVSTELTKVLRGSGGAESDVQGWLKQLSDAAPPAQRNSAISAILDAMNSRLENLGSQYSSGMSKSVSGIQLLTPHAQQQLKLLQSSTDSSAEAPKVAVNPKTGERVVYDPATRAWKPA